MYLSISVAILYMNSCVLHGMFSLFPPKSYESSVKAI